jgi:MoxR-like ATPase
VELEGTYPLPEAQIDRFMCKLTLNYPSLDDDLKILESYNSSLDLHRLADQDLQPITSPEQILECRAASRRVQTEPAILRYLAEIVRATRVHPQVQLGASPRGAIHLLLLSKVLAVMDGREFVTPDDVKFAAAGVLAHRLMLSAEAQVAARTPTQILNDVLRTIEVPR